ncbi:3'-5' exonuclease [Streptomyces sp. NRRL F-5630]|uniref:3'-5' exonuclease n=1 Tax=Streptomyces sp. NRRL F-5630 TaxID=1463864 RepID=UPI003EBBDF37
MSVKLAFVDTETTGLDPFLHEAWEIAVIVREGDGPDVEHTFRIRPDLSLADPEALKINRYMERVTAPGWEWEDRLLAALGLYPLLDSAIMIGSNPAFDAEMLAHLLGRYYEKPKPWHYRTVDIATLAAGRKYGMVDVAQQVGAKAYPSDEIRIPFSSRDLSRWVGVEPPGDGVAHTALGDARWARDVWDAVTVGTTKTGAAA